MTGWDIYTIRPDGTGLRPLIATAADEQTPAWSANGKRIAFVRPDGLWTANADGTAQRLIAMDANALNPAWSRDGRRIAYQASDPTTGVSEIEVVKATGGQPSVLHKGVSPTWSPDGSRIAFAYVYAVPVHVEAQLETMSPDGTDVMAIPGGDVFGPISRVDWSPDGRAIAFSQPNYRAPSGHIGIISVTTGAQPTFVSDSGDVPGVSWSPDGSRLAYWKNYFGADQALSALVTSNLDGGDPFVLTHGADAMPAWQPVLPSSKQECKKGGWDNYGNRFTNQGHCISYIEAGR